MTVEFIRKIMEERIVDTKKYRYVAEDCGRVLQIKRLPITALGTTQALDGWEVLAEYEHWTEVRGAKG